MFADQHVFRDYFRDRTSNSPTGSAAMADLLDQFAGVIKGDFLPSLTATVRSAETASAILFCTILTAKRENLDLSFRSLVDEAKGRSFSAKLINWAMDKMDAEIADDLKVAWGSLHQQMSSTIEMLIRFLEPNILPHSPMPRVEEIVTWIAGRGGIGKLHMEYMNVRRADEQAEKSAKEADRKAGREARLLRLAQSEGFDTIESYEAAVAQREKDKRQAALRSKFEVVKKRLVANGMAQQRIPESGLLIAQNGVVYLLSEDDEFSLLSCAAAVI